MGRITGFRNSTTGIDIGQNLVEKSYLIDRYPELADTFKQAGLWKWGFNAQSGANKSSPVQTVAGGTNWKQVVAGWTNHAGIKTDGTLWTWGSQTYGELAQGGTGDTAAQVIGGGNNWKEVSCNGSSASVSAIKTDGTLWLWGLNDYGQLGDNTVVNKSSPVQTVAGGTNWKQVSTGQQSSAAIKTDGTLWMWGINNTYQLGTGDGIRQSSPVQTIAGGTNWKQVSCGGQHTGAIKTDGTLWMWGFNVYGQIGNNSATTYFSSPVQTVSAGSNWKQVECSSMYMSAGIKTDGSLWLWGRNNQGQLGNNTRTNASSPVQTVAAGTNWKQIKFTSNYETTVSLKTDGTVWCWGLNDYGQLGDGTSSSKSSPVQTVAGGTNWKSVLSSGGIRDDSADIFGNPV